MEIYCSDSGATRYVQFEKRLDMGRSWKYISHLKTKLGGRVLVTRVLVHISKAGKRPLNHIDTSWSRLAAPNFFFFFFFDL